MANGGWYGTKTEWERIEKPLIEVDSYIDDFSQEFNLECIRNFKDHPARSFEWFSGDVRCFIQLYLADKNELTWNLWLCVSQDRTVIGPPEGKRERYWKTEMLVQSQSMQEFRDELPNLLRTARIMVNNWKNSPDILEYATDIESI